MEKENDPTTSAKQAADEQQVNAWTETLLKIAHELDQAVQNPCDPVDIADAAEEMLFSLPGLQKVAAEKREEISIVILAIVEYTITQGIIAAGTYLGVRNTRDFTEVVETYCETHERLISCDTIGTLVDAHIVKEKDEETAHRQLLEKEKKLHHD